MRHKTCATLAEYESPGNEDLGSVERPRRAGINASRVYFGRIAESLRDAGPTQQRHCEFISDRAN